MRYLNRDRRHMERLLRAARPEPSAELMQALTPRKRVARRQFAFAGALTAALAISLAAVGGVSYAATAVQHAVKAATKIVKTHHAATPLVLSAGGDQYKPGYGFGDPNHNHSGPPGLAKGKPGEKTPPAQVRKIGNGRIVTSSLTVDEQAALYFSVIDADGNQLLLTQKGSKIGNSVHGRQVKTIHYVMLVPRTVPFSLRIPANLLVPGKTYSIRIIAVDSDGNKSSTLIPFTA
jgi:hypothetical protein